MAEEPIAKDAPRRFKLIMDKSGDIVLNGCYFPRTDLCVYEDGRRFTGTHPDFTWVDPIPEHLVPKDPTKK